MNTASDKHAAPIRAVVVYRVCQHWRTPMFARLNSHPDITLAVFHGKDIPGTKLINSKQFKGFDHKEMFTISGKAKSSGRKVPWVCCPFVFWNLLKHKPDVVVVEGASNIFTNVFVFVYAKLWRKPVVWWTLGMLTDRKFTGLGKLYRWVVVGMERWSTALLGYSSAALAYFTRMGYQPERFFRAVNCVDTERIFKEIDRGTTCVTELRRRLALEQKQVVLFVGALTPEKKIDRLIRAFSEVSKHVGDGHLLVVGDGPDRSRLESLTDELGCSNVVTFAGQVVDNVSNYYELGHVFVLPGLGGLAISEAMTHGLPVICSRGDGCEVDLVRDGKTGFRIDEDDEQAVTQFLSEKLIYILSHDEQKRMMSEAARAVIQNEHNVDSYIENVVDAIRYAHTGVRTNPYPVQVHNEETP